MSTPRIPVKKANPDDYQYATYIKDRRPQFKVHRTIGHAHAALSWKTHRGRISTDMAFYFKNGDEWVPKYEWDEDEPITHFPWEVAPPSPDEVAANRRKEEWRRLLSQLTAFCSSASPVQRADLSFKLRTLAETIEKSL